MNVDFTKVNRVFKLYQREESKIESTFFDLISGDTETKQTKGLAYLLKIYPEILSELLKDKDIVSSLKAIGVDLKDIGNSDLITIDAEMLSEGVHSIRRDITITFYTNNKKKLVIIMEAKNIKVNNTGDIELQLNSYFDPVNFPTDDNVPKLGISLTKHRFLFDKDSLHFVSITWSQIIELLNKVIRKDKQQMMLQSQLLQEYLNFLMEVDSGVRFYEKEVLSVPAGDTIQQIIKYHIHACPNNKSHSYKTPLYIAFREKGGFMDTLYQIEEIIVFNPNSPSYETVITNSNLSSKERILKYTDERKVTFGFKKKDCDYRFYVLSEKKKIIINHKPRIPALSGHCYFSLPELLSGKEYVVVESNE